MCNGALPHAEVEECESEQGCYPFQLCDDVE